MAGSAGVGIKPQTTNTNNEKIEMNESKSMPNMKRVAELREEKIINEVGDACFKNKMQISSEVTQNESIEKEKAKNGDTVENGEHALKKD